VWRCSHTMRSSRIYETIGCPSVRPSVSYQRRAAGMLLSAVPAEDVDIQRRAAGAQQQRHLSRGPQHGAQQQMRAVSR